jgi:hypothetical protein
VRLPPNAIDGLSTPNPHQKAFLQSSLMQAARAAFEASGKRAFEASEHVAALHEAGHATLYGLAGIPVRQLWIKCVKVNGASTWIGRCETDAHWQVDEYTSPTDDRQFARILMAGCLAEVAFARDEFRLGSSLDETILAGAICSGAAHKLRQQPSAVLLETVAETLDTLCAHEKHVRAIASALMRSRKLRGPKLDRLLLTALAHG